MRYFVTCPVEGRTQWYDVRDRNPDGPLGMNGVFASFSVHLPGAEGYALTLNNILNSPEIARRRVEPRKRAIPRLSDRTRLIGAGDPAPHGKKTNQIRERN